jgi:hypothetical protein
MQQRRFKRLTNGHSKKLEHHAAAVALFVGYYTFCRVHETIKTAPAVAIGIADHVWSIGELLDAALFVRCWSQKAGASESFASLTAPAGESN